MLLIKPFLMGISAFVLTGCMAAGEDAAQEWVSKQRLAGNPMPSGALPSIEDTPPATFTAINVVDPFSPERVSQQRAINSAQQGDSNGKVYFSNLPLSAVRNVGFIASQGHRSTAVDGAGVYVYPQVGDRLSNEQIEIVEISAKGIRMRQADGSEFWLSHKGGKGS